MSSQKVFLTADWRHLAMLNFEIQPSVLEPYLPKGTELAFWNGKTFASIVGFLFLNTKVLGWPIPFFRNFEEVNLRFYVTCNTPEGDVKKGVVFIKEIVPKFAIASVARWGFGEHYVTMSMRHSVSETQVEYGWKTSKRWNSLSVKTTGELRIPANGSHEDFIMHNYWGYTALPDSRTGEYRVDHSRWRFREASEHNFDCDVAELYGNQFVHSLTLRPFSVFVVEGSSIAVHSRSFLSYS